MNESITMQSEEIEDIRSNVDEPLPDTEMTYTDNGELSSPRLKPPVITEDSKSTLENDFLFDPVKLEADIELDESSHTSENEDPPTDLPIPKPFLHPTEKLPPEAFTGTLQDQNSNQSIRTWLQRITQMQNEIQKKLNQERNCNSTQSFMDFPMKPAENSTAQNSSRVVKYQDLPYMGEMTLDNSKPRRGRKPKKADICHLIYKNYGTIFPGTPNPRSLLERESLSSKKTTSTDASVAETFNRSDVQNRIISSLLEKRLTQESKRSKETLIASKRTLQKHDQDEPMNLCIRDLNQLKIRLLKKPLSSDLSPEIKSEPQSDDEVEFVHETPSVSSNKPEVKFPSLPDTPNSVSNEDGPGGYVYWPNAGVFIHPMALQQHLMYYQRLAANNNYTLPSHSPRPPPENRLNGRDNPVPELRKIVPKQRTKKSDVCHEQDANTPAEQKTKRNAPSSTEKTPTKRKRSAIFIPPIPAENQTNPATEVSICKFKFTGGAKPSLQEKKMLSVDSGGNFRYYSGTGDKSMRGYEFFPRETLQQQIGNTQGSSTGAFLQASGEKIYPGSPVDFAGKQSAKEFLLTPELPAPALSSLQELTTRHKKRKSRKSLQREKLEQTFKEKGFLIQTQQLESAEGATYCKFRQLRKFTRYLFRSWKDYLPGNVRELQEAEKSENEDVPETDLDSVSRQSSSSGVVSANAQ